MREGTLIEFKDKRRIVAAAVTRLDAGSVRLLTEANKEFNLPLNKVAHETSVVVPTSGGRGETVERLKQFAQEAEALRATIDLQSLWELLKDEPGPFSLTELAGYCADSPSPQQVSALLRVLQEEGLYFDWKGDVLVPREEKAIAQTLQQRAVEAERARQRERLTQWIHAVWQDEQPETPEGADKLLTLLKEIAIWGNRSERFVEGVSWLQEAGLGHLDPAEVAFHLLVKLGLWDIDENLLLHEFRLLTPYAPAALAEVEALKDWQPSLGDRRDLRHLACFTIDDEETADIDDALSLEALPEGWRVGIHIADVAAFIPKGSALDQEAMHRATTLYLPDRKLEMLPTSLSSDWCSLVAGRDRWALSFLVTFDANEKVVGWEMTPSLVHVRERLTYEAAEGALPFRDDLSRLSSLAEALQRRRQGQGAIIFNLPEIKIRVGPDKRISVKRMAHNTLAQRLVSELMILANQLIAERCRDQGVPALFRTQPAPEENLAPLEGSEDPVVLARQRRMMKRSEWDVAPAPHHGLGLAVYTQATSPIRRYTDLVMHRQLKALWQGEPVPYTEDELRLVLASTDQAQSTANLVQRQSYRYWLLKHLQELGEQPLKALVLDVQEERVLVQLTDFLLDLPLVPQAAKSYSAGETVWVKATQIRPRRGSLLLVETSPRAEETANPPVLQE